LKKFISVTCFFIIFIAKPTINKQGLMNKIILHYKLFLTFAFFNSLLLPGYTQVSNYLFTQSNITYTDITGGTVLVPADNTDSDDEVYPGNAIGFTFNYNGTDHTTFGISSNGFLWLGSGEPAPDTYTPISGSSANLDGTGTINGVISPLGRDLFKRTTNPFGEIRIETVGTTPNRTCIIQYKDWRSYGLDAIYNFQVRLHETTNTIDLLYGSFTIITAIELTDLEIGLRGNSDADFNNVLAENANWDAAVSGTMVTDAAVLSPIIYPASGTMFTFTPPNAGSCVKPGGLVVTPINAYADSILWAKVAAAVNYEWDISNTATPPLSGTATAGNNDTTLLATGLDSATTYYFHVRSNCGNGDYSGWTTRSFTTLRPHDICSDAKDISALIGLNSADTLGKGSLLIAGLEGISVNAPCSGLSTGGINDTWLKFTAPAGTDSIIIAGTGGSYDDWIFQVFENCGGAQLACNDDGEADNPFGENLMPVIGLCNLSPGVTYYIRAYPYEPIDAATANIYLYKGGSCAATAVNDVCAGAIDITNTCAAPVSGTTVNSAASGNISNTSCGSPFGNQTDVWYKFSTGSNIILPFIKITQIDTADGSKRVYASVYHGSCGNLIYDGCVGASAGSDSIIAYIPGVDSDQDYFVRVYSLGAAGQTTFNISICDSTSNIQVDTTGSGACNNLGSLVIDAANQNNNRWVRVISSGLLLEINANGNDLGATSFSVYRNATGTVRRDNSRILPDLGREYMDRNITITPTNQPTTPVRIRMYFTNDELNALVAAAGDGYADVSNILSLVVTKNQQDCSDVFDGTFQTVFIAPSSNGNFSDGAFVEFEVSSFSSFFLNGGNTALPVSLLNFTAVRNGRSNLLSWSTSQEFNSSKFIIERSTDGRYYTPIGQVAAAGSSTVQRSYSFTDASPIRGINYYRLRMVDLNAAEKTSAIRNVRNQGSADVLIYPNPAKAQLVLDITCDKKDRANILVTDISGKQVLSRQSIGVTEGLNRLNINTSNLTAGAYIIKIQLSDDVVVKKFNKQ
jgi:hypothetical protein